MSIADITALIGGALGASGSSGGGAGAGADDILNLEARWPRVARWYPDGTQEGFPAPLIRFASAGQDVFAAADAASEATGTDRRTMVRVAAEATGAAIVREALDAGGGDGNPSLSCAVGWEALGIFDLTNVSVAQWLLLGGFATAGSFPFPEIFSLGNVAGVGFSTRAPVTPIADLEVLSTNGAAAISRATLAGARALNVRLAVSSRLYVTSDPGGARLRGRARILSTGVETEQSLTTNLPTGMLHFTCLHNVGAVPSGDAGIIIRHLAVGRPA